MLKKTHFEFLLLIFLMNGGSEWRQQEHMIDVFEGYDYQ